jgi:hypothetical protein
MEQRSQQLGFGWNWHDDKHDTTTLINSLSVATIVVESVFWSTYRSAL